MKSPESSGEKTIIENGNANESTNIQGDYNHSQEYGDSNDVKVTVVNQFNQRGDTPDWISRERKKCVIELDGSFADILLDPAKREDFLKGLELLKQIDPTLKMRDIEPGSIKITLEGSEEGIEQILDLIESGVIDNIADLPIVNAQISDRSRKTNLSSVEKQSTNRFSLRSFFSKIQKKILTSNRLVRKLSALMGLLKKADFSNIALRGADLRGADLSGANLRRADLSGANLRGTDLSDADLRGANLFLANLSETNLFLANLFLANLRGANLSEANLSEANLSEANLSEANLRGANLRGANLSEANLSEANLSGADLEKTIFGYNEGLSEDMKADFIRRGAIFQDSPGSGDRVLLHG